MKKNDVYGKELIMDIHDCDPGMFTRKALRKYLKQVCAIMKMERADLQWWDYHGQKKEYKEAPDHLKGTSLVQFISTSDIVIHTLDVYKKMFINLFSCKDYDSEQVRKFTVKYFKGELARIVVLERA